MADYWYKLGQNSIVLRIKLRDTASAQAAGKTGLAYNTSGMSIAIIADNAASGTAYTAAGSTIEAVGTLGTYAAPTATKCRFSEVDATNHKGLYEIQIADAQFSVANAKSVAITIQCGTTIFERTIIIPLQQLDVYNAAPKVTLADIDKTAMDAGSVAARNLADWAGNAASVGGTWVANNAVPHIDDIGSIDAIKAKTDLLNAGATGMIKADIQAAMGTAMTQAAGAGKVAGALSKLLDVATPVFTAASVNQSIDNGPTVTQLQVDVGDVALNLANVPSAATNAAAVWDLATTGHTTAGTFGACVARITSTLFSGITSLAQWLGAIVGKQTPNTTALTEIRATGAGSGTYEPNTDSLEALQIELGSGLLAMTDAFTAVKGATFDTATDSLEAIRDRGDEAWTTGTGGGGAGAGTGADECTMTITSGGVAVADAQVWITSDAAGATVVAGYLPTDSQGNAKFLLDAGTTYYLWMQKDGINSILGEQFVAVAD